MTTNTQTLSKILLVMPSLSTMSKGRMHSLKKDNTTLSSILMFNPRLISINKTILNLLTLCLEVQLTRETIDKYHLVILVAGRISHLTSLSSSIMSLYRSSIRSQATKRLPIDLQLKPMTMILINRIQILSEVPKVLKTLFFRSSI